MKEFNSFNVYSKVEYVEMLESLQRKARELQHTNEEKDAEDIVFLREIEGLQDRLTKVNALRNELLKALIYWHDRYDVEKG